MLNEWISIAEDKKIEEAVELCEAHTEDIYRELIGCLEEIKGENPDLSNVVDKIENLFIIKTRHDVSFVFPKALRNGIEIGKCIR